MLASMLDESIYRMTLKQIYRESPLAFAIILGYRKKSLEVCKELIKFGKTYEAGQIIVLLENNINELQE